MTEKIFILGVGAQKAGTTWLHRELSKCPSINMGDLKEYKCIRNSENNILNKFKRRKKDIQTIQKLTGSITKPTFNELLSMPKDQKQAWMTSDNSLYYRYFESLFENSPSTLATGDISPHYCGLTSKTLIRARKQLEKRGFKVKVIFLMRDPVERIWSQVRMIRQRRTIQSVCNFATEKEAILGCYAIDRMARNTRYEETIRNLENAFPTHNIHYEFYENLFQENSFKRLETFLGIQLTEPDFERRINESPKNLTLPEDIARKVALEYRNTYQAIEEKFGAQSLELWTNSKFIKHS